MVNHLSKTIQGKGKPPPILRLSSGRRVLSQQSTQESHALFQEWARGRKLAFAGTQDVSKNQERARQTAPVPEFLIQGNALRKARARCGPLFYAPVDQAHA